MSLDVLELMLADMAAAEAIHRPTSYWQPAVDRIAGELRDEGMDAFRRLPSALDYFVPTYGRRSPGWQALVKAAPGAAGRVLDRVVSGREAALADYRVLAASSSRGPWELATVSESGHGQPVGRFTFNGTTVSRSWLNYGRGLAFLQATIDVAPIRTCLEIGGGFGTLGEWLARVQPGALYVDVDIPPVAAVAQFYLQQVLGPDRVLGYEQSRDMDVIDLADLAGTYDVVVLCPWQLPRVVGAVDLFANFISFQEMEPEVVANYAAEVERLGAEHLLLRNSVAGKEQVEAGRVSGVETPITSGMYESIFAGHDVLARDALVHGQVTHDFSSEVLVMRRKQA